MTSNPRYTGLAATHQGRTRQITKAYKGIADDLKRSRAGQPADCDQPQTLEDALRRIAFLEQQLADAQTLIEEMRGQANSDASVEAVAESGKSWSTKTVADKSGVAICTIIRNVDTLGGWQLESGDWRFPVGTIYGRRRKAK